jgi:hypothetical protein
MNPNIPQPLHFNRTRGQSLVEMALILPLIFFVLLTYFQLLVTCHNAIVLQGMTAKAVRAEALREGSGTINTLQALFSETSLLGNFVPPRSARDTALLNPWRPFKGLVPNQTIQTPGYLMSTRMTSSMLPKKLFIWRLPRVSLNFLAEYPKEPPIPGEE